MLRKKNVATVLLISKTNNNIVTITTLIVLLSAQSQVNKGTSTYFISIMAANDYNEIKRENASCSITFLIYTPYGPLLDVPWTLAGT